MMKTLILVLLTLCLVGAAVAITIPAGWANSTDAQRAAFADKVIARGQTLTELGVGIRSAIEKGQNALALLDELGFEISEEQEKAIRNRFIKPYKDALDALPDTIQ